LSAGLPGAPGEHGGVLLVPGGVSEGVRQALANRDRLRDAAFLGLPVAAMRAGLGVPVDVPVVLSGHQPLLLHPGIYAKSLFASAIARALDAPAFHKVTDTDVPREWDFRFPGAPDPGGTNPFFPADRQDTPYADQPAPSPAALEALLDRCAAGAPPSWSSRLGYWRPRLEASLRGADSWVSFQLATLRALDDLTGLDRSLLVSSLLFQTPAFLRYAAAWLKSLDALGEATNRALDRFRAETGSRNAAEPSPNLRTDGDWREAPFWLTRPGGPRRTLWAMRTGPDGAVLRGADGEGEWRASWTDGVLRVEGDVRVWPKALPQSLFVRLFLCDLFIHGVGGARYERVNDHLFRSLFGSEPPFLGVASATLHADPEALRAAEEALARSGAAWSWKRRFEQNPEYVATREAEWGRDLPGVAVETLLRIASSGDFRATAVEKEALLRGLKDPAGRRGSGRRIQEVNRSLREALGPLDALFGPVERELERRQAARDSWGWREYPFFLHEPGTFGTLRDRIASMP
jgi:hypothetical protein